MDDEDVALFHQACRLVMEAAERSKPGSLLQYAHSYARAGLSMHSKESIKVQCLYILNNCTGWRGDGAKAAKLVLNRYSK